MNFPLSVCSLTLKYSGIGIVKQLDLLHFIFQTEMSLYDGLDIDKEDGGSTKPVVGM